MSVAFALQLESWTRQCLAAEETRGLGQRSLRELTRYFAQFVRYARSSAAARLSDLTPQFLTTFLLRTTSNGNGPLVKAYVWALRTLGGFLAVRQITGGNLAAQLRHPKISKRAHLPEHLTAEQLRLLLETTALNHSLMDLCVVSLLATTGLRPHEIARMKRADVLLGRQHILLKVKGNWLRRVPLSDRMIQLFTAWFEQRSDASEFAFITHRGRPLYPGWILAMVRQAGRDAGLPFRLTPRHLRHTFATFCVDRHGVTVTRALLGHATAEHTAVYTHMAPRKFRRIMLVHPYQTFPERGGFR
jgi:integrase/recombinase XerC